MNTAVHEPVLTPVLLDHLALQAGATCIDATIDGGGHTTAILEHTAPNGRVLGIDRDPDLVAAVRQRLAPAVDAGRLRLACANFRELTRIAAEEQFERVDAVVLDLGVSSYHLDASGRGFSFAHDEPLDLRFDPTDRSLETGADIANTRSAAELTDLLRSLGEERYARRIAQAIVARGKLAPVRTSAELLDLVRLGLPGKVRWQAARSAARVFQALRIGVNDELDAVAAVLPQAVELLAPGGRLAVISFHSLEDRIVKQFFVAQRHAGRLRILTKKPLRATDEEIAANPRAASAKLRVAERV